MLISPEKLSELKNAVDIVEVISEYLPLKKAGKRYKALCPFHPDTAPSFYVSGDRQSYKCFGCGMSGDVISFLQAMDHLSFPEALRALSRRAGIVLELDEASGKTSGMVRANEFACSYYQDVLWNKPEGEPAREYLRNRAINREIAEKFRLGYAPPGWESLKASASRKGIAGAELADAGLLTVSSKGTQIDFFRQRLMFPIFDIRSRVIGFGGRVLDDSLPKYINSPDSVLFRKSGTLYGLNFAKMQLFHMKQVLITEGYTDVIRAHEKGIDYAVATLGTAFTDSHARVLKRYVDTVYVVFDADEAGRKAAERSLEILLGEELAVRVATLPGGADLFDFLGSAGEDDFKRLIRDAVEFLDFKYESAATRHDLSTSAGKAAATDEMLGVLRAIRNPVLRGLEIKRMAGRIGVEERELRARLGRAEVDLAEVEYIGSVPGSLRGLDLIDIILNRPDLAGRVTEAFPPESYIDPELGRIASILWQSHEEKGTVSTECVFEQPDGEDLRQKLLDVLSYTRQFEDKPRDYEALLAAWVSKKEEEHLASKIKQKGEENPAESLVEYFELRKKSRQKHGV